MPTFGLFSQRSATTDNSSASGSSSSRNVPPQNDIPSDHPPIPAGTDSCPVDHSTRSAWLAAAQPQPDPSAAHPFNPSSSVAGPSSSPSRPTRTNSLGLGTDRVISSIPRASTSYPSSEGSIPYPAAAQPESSHGVEGSVGKEKDEKWVYPSEAQFFAAMQRKNHKPKREDMRTVVPIHNAVNERAWEQVLMWEAGMGSDRCGGPRLISFSGRPKDLTPKAWFKTLAGYKPPFDRHDWLIDRCGTQVRYVIDFYTGRSDPNHPERMAFYLDVRPAVDNWDGIRTRWAGLWK